MRTLLCAIVVLRLLADVATPHLPGAFQFDPDESVEGLRATTPRATNPILPAVRPVPETGERHAVRPLGRLPRHAATVASAVELRPRLARHTRDTLTESAEDH